MSRRPIKIIFDDGSKEDFDEALDWIDRDDIIQYAEWYLDMKEEADIEQKEIDDFSDDEILDELLFRYNIHKDIVSMEKLRYFLNNFYNL